MTRPRASWALWSKRPGDADDYRLLDCSPGLRPEFDRVLREDGPGNPTTTEAERPDSLPWITVGTSPGVAVFLSVLTWTAYADVHGRAVTATRIFAGDLGPVLATAGFAAAYRAVAELELPASAAAVELELDPPPVTSMRPALPSGLTPEWAARVAALLLDGRIVVRGADELDAEARLGVVDLVAAFLPAGYRWYLTVTTWVARTDRRSQRMCFGPGGGDAAVEVRLDVPAPEPRNPVAARYLRELTKWLDRDPALLHAHLNAAAEPIAFEQGPERALAIVQDLDLPVVLLEEISQGIAAPPRVLDFLERRGPTGFGTRVGEAYRFLLDRLGIDAVSKLAPYWSAELADEVVRAVRHGLPRESRGAVAEDFVRLAAEHGHHENLLVRLLATVGGQDTPPELRQVGLRAFKELPAMPVLRATLLTREQAGACIGLVGECQEVYPADVPLLVTWLADDPGPVPEWIEVLHHILVANSRKDRPPRPTTVEAAVRQHRGVVVLAFVRAVGRRDLNLLGPALWTWVVRAAVAPPDFPLRRLIERELPAGVAVAANPRSRAWIDLALVACEAPPAAVAGADRDAPSIAAYVEEWAAALEDLPDELAAIVAPRMPDAVVTTLLAAPRPQAGTAAALVLAEVVNRPLQWRPEHVGPTVARLLERPGGSALLPVIAEHAGRHWTALVQSDPDLRRTLPRLQLREMARVNAEPEKLATAWATLVAIEGLPTGGGRGDLEELVEWPGRGAQAAVLRLVDGTALLLREQMRVRGVDLDRWRNDTLRAVVRRKALGHDAAERTRAALLVAADQIRRDRMRRLEELDQEVERLQREIAKVDLARTSEVSGVEQDRVRLAELVGAAAAGFPWWSWRRWWPVR